MAGHLSAAEGMERLAMEAISGSDSNARVEAADQGDVSGRALGI